tara:strand:- start:553 stop:714 length:162 start_codon:yes stop_codon:yes gene_type:complete
MKKDMNYIEDLIDDLKTAIQEEDWTLVEQCLQVLENIEEDDDRQDFYFERDDT